ncbi:HEAT repeat domain-containing protein [Dermatobacter hominis]|uniref:HEAT repeat domain-containing protein n=1 Tax=Dermatobacter hominis TaxID=2884263 RepID=UPI001D119C38|nr:HEAT repeat domain-containing protein [Dermatobacter hominis]UDY34866.1 HEAT repeat domain-containing protein [Dermatobacter hominis]
MDPAAAPTDGPDDADRPTASDADAPRVTGAGSDRTVRVVRAGHDGDADLVAAAHVDPDPAVRAAAVGASVRLARSGVIGPSAALDAVLAALSDGDAAVRRRAAAEAGRLAGAVDLDADLVAIATAPLVERLGDEDDRVAEVVAFAVGELPLADAPSALDLAVASLAEVATGHAEHLCREAAVAALGSIGDPGGLPAVLAGCRDRATVRRRAVLALAAFDDPAATDELRRLTADRDLQVRQAAEELLAIEAGEAT